MINEFVPYRLSQRLQELGFNEECLATYSGEVLDLNLQIKSDDYFTSGPLWQQAFEWFRERHNLVGTVYANASGYLFEIHDSAKLGGSHKYDSGFSGPNDSGCWSTFRDAQLACLEKLISMI